MVRWKVKAGFLLNRNRKILPGALYQRHFTDGLKKALASRGPVTPVGTVIKRASFISAVPFLSFPSLRIAVFFLCSSAPSFLRQRCFFLYLRLRSPALILFETLTTKSVSMSTFVLFSKGIYDAHAFAIRVTITPRDGDRCPFQEKPARTVMALLNFSAKMERVNGNRRGGKYTSVFF